MALSFARHRDALEQEGVYIGGWSFRNALFPKKLNGKHGKYSSTDLWATLIIAKTAAKTGPKMYIHWRQNGPRRRRGP